MYHTKITGGIVPTDLDACGGRVGITPDSNNTTIYYYVITNQPPFTLGCFGSVESYPVSLQQCRDLYPDNCNDEKAFCVETDFGSGLYNLGCPCYDRETRSNVLVPEGVPGYLEDGVSMGKNCGKDEKEDDKEHGNESHDHESHSHESSDNVDTENDETKAKNSDTDSGVVSRGNNISLSIILAVILPFLFFT